MPNTALTKDFSRLALTLEHKKHTTIEVRNKFKNGVCYYIQLCSVFYTEQNDGPICRPIHRALHGY